ncbi:MAG: uroporphyrinogen decarboxylase [Cucumibacter sp.]
MHQRTGRRVLDAAHGFTHERPPIWIMRQAGRYLPEYRQLREKTGSFLELCYTPKLASEVTLQPMRRFDLDAAIVFSDILVVPDALGQKVRFAEGEGPILEPFEALGRLALDRAVERLRPVMETIVRVRAALSSEKTLIGFCGGPWTVATYMIGGTGSLDQAATRLFAFSQPAEFSALLEMLVEVSADYLAEQLKAGVDLVQIFESWGGNLDEELFRDFVIEPTRGLVERLRSKVPEATVIGFPRGAGPMIPSYIEATGVNALGLDETVPLDFARSTIRREVALQGNLDPLRLCAGGAQMQERVEAIISAFADRPHIFNLGHGIVPETPIENVAALVAQVKGRP